MVHLPSENADRSGPAIGVVYLAWHALGSTAFQRFADSYRRHPAGCKHDLIVIYAGFDQQRNLNDAASVFLDIPHIGIELPDVALDICYYLETALRVTHEYLCFLNTYTELSAPNWLAYLYVHAARDGVGIAGATGSFESLSSSVGLYQRIKWSCDTYGNKVSERAAYYFGYHLRDACPLAVIEPTVQLPPQMIERWVARCARFVGQREQDMAFQAYWEMMTGSNMMFADYRRFPAFPNPHIRTNGFMVQRLRLAPFKASQIQTKFDACAFESGTDSLTAQLRRAGLAAIVVASDGEGYDVPDWWRSDTFRLGDQTRLILTDNRSRDFASMSAGERIVHLRITWGDYLGPAPSDFPDFGFSFAKGSYSPRQSKAKTCSRPGTFDPLCISCRLALRVMRIVTLDRPVGRARSFIVSKARSAARQALRAALPPFRRLDERVAADARKIACLEAEINVLGQRIRSLEDGKMAKALAQSPCEPKSMREARSVSLNGDPIANE